MTLQQWSEQYGVLSTHPTTESKSVSLCVNQFHEGVPELYHLDDYTVSTRNGPVFWLIPDRVIILTSMIRKFSFTSLYN